mmetsp:Transcript_48871/g.135851  ORF Transcript_48871/g.135851 Transcript_48871/m.135851 type:complete len:413 (+) Transcript_48871:1244-2482(+)
MVEEDAVHRVPERVEAAEGEGEVAEAPAEGHTGARTPDLRHGFDEVDPVGVVLREPRGDGQHVAVKDDVLGVKVQLRAQEPVAPHANAHLVFIRCSLALLIEGHDDNGGAKALAEFGLPQEFLLPHLQGDGVHDALALHALQALLDHRPLRGVDHEGQPRDVRLRDAHAHELAHGQLPVDEVRVEVEVQDVGLLLALGEAHLHGFVPLVRVHQLLELRGAHEVAPLADPLEPSLRLQDARLQAGQLHAWVLGQLRELARGAVLDLLGHGGDVRGERAAAAAHEVEQAVLGVVEDVGRKDLGVLVIAAHGVRQAGVGVDVAPAAVHVRQLLVELLHLGRTERAVDADREGLRVPDADVEGLDGLARERAAAVVHNGGADHDRKPLLLGLLEVLVHREDGSLGVLGVEDSLDHQ